jgi:hypothetical protein
MNESEFRYTLLRSRLVSARPGLAVHEGREDAGVVDAGPARVLAGHSEPTRHLLKGSDRVRATALEIEVELRSLSLGQEDDVRLALETAAKLVDWAESRLHDATASDSTGTPVSRSISSANDSEGFRKPRAMSER